jgi:antitoxin ParD1/3/4
MSLDAADPPAEDGSSGRLALRTGCVVGFLYIISTLYGYAMHINLSPEMEQYLQSKVSAGFYSNASEVVRDAIRRMREEDEKLAALRAAVAVGDEQLMRSEGAPYSAELLEKLTDRAMANARAAKKVTPDVTS